MKQKVIICDIDGTVALRGDRGPYDWSRVGEDKPNWPVIQTLAALQWFHYWPVVFVSGRMEQCRKATEKWLNEHVDSREPWHLFMRQDKDNRSDVIVKREIYCRDIEPHFDVRLVFDDRNSVVKMWRELGLPCMQVADGDF